ncbi:MAG: S-adenosylmethionine decarboxylase [Chromatiales bacterium]
MQRAQLSGLGRRPERQDADTGAAVTNVQIECWGFHLIVDVKGCVTTALDDDEHLKDCIRSLTQELGIKAMGEPILHHYRPNEPEKAGFVVVQTGEGASITAHFVRRTGDAYLDIVSCTQFSMWQIERILDRLFMPQSMTLTFITRQA